MRKIFQSELGVGCLTAVAVLCVAGNFINFQQRRTGTVAARENTLEEAPEDAYQVPPLSRVAVELRDGRERFPLDTLRRDPFAAVFVPPAAAVTNTPIMPSFQLQAVSLAAGKLLAVINNRVVAEGERIDGCLVEKILSHEVRLVSPVFGPLTATFDRTPFRSGAGSDKKSASANSSAADLPAGPAAAFPGSTGGTVR